MGEWLHINLVMGNGELVIGNQLRLLAIATLKQKQNIIEAKQESIIIIFVAKLE